MTKGRLLQHRHLQELVEEKKSSFSRAVLIPLVYKTDLLRCNLNVSNIPIKSGE